MILFVFVPICFIASLCSCNNVTSDDVEITDGVKSEILNFDFTYEYKVTGNQLSYNFVWDGYDLENKFGPKLSEEKRLYTYLTE